MGSVNGSYSNNYGFDSFDEDLARAIAMTSEEQNLMSSTSSSISTQKYDDSDEEELQQALTASLEDQGDDITQQSKKQKFLFPSFGSLTESGSFLSPSFSSCFSPTSITEPLDECISPDVALKRGQKRKSSEKTDNDFVPKPIYRINVIDEALPKVFASGITDIVITFDEDPQNDIIRIIQQGNHLSKTVQRLAYAVISLDLNNFPKIKNINEIFKSFIKVATLRLPLWAEKKHLNVIAEVKALQSELRGLDLEITGDHCTGINHINGSDFTKFENLKRLKLQYAWGISDTDLNSLAQLKTIESLNLSSLRNGITDAGLASLTQLENLQEFVLHSEYSEDITDAGFSNFAKLKKLQSLRLEFSNNITDIALASIHEHESLNELGLKRCDNITDAGIAGLKKLQKLSLDNCRAITDAGLNQLENLLELEVSCNNISVAGLSRLTKLQKLKLSYWTDITSADLLSLSNFTNLRELVLEQNLPNNVVTDADLVSLAKLTKLQKLKLKGFYNLTDEVLVALAKLGNLKEIDLERCVGSTDVGIARAKEINNSLQINKLVMPPLSALKMLFK